MASKTNHAGETQKHTTTTTTRIWGRITQQIFCLLVHVLCLWTKYWLPHSTIKQHITKDTKTNWGYFRRRLFLSYSFFLSFFLQHAEFQIRWRFPCCYFSVLPCNVDFKAKGTALKTRLHKGTRYKTVNQ